MWRRSPGLCAKVSNCSCARNYWLDQLTCAHHLSLERLAQQRETQGLIFTSKPMFRSAIASYLGDLYASSPEAEATLEKLRKNILNAGDSIRVDTLDASEMRNFDQVTAGEAERPQPSKVSWIATLSSMRLLAFEYADGRLGVAGGRRQGRHEKTFVWQVSVRESTRRPR